MTRLKFITITAIFILTLSAASPFALAQDNDINSDPFSEGLQLYYQKRFKDSEERFNGGIG